MIAKQVVKEIESFSGNRLKRKSDLEIIIDLAFQNKKQNLLEGISFTAKYILGLQRVIKKGNTNPEITNLEQIKNDYTDNMKKAVGWLKEIINLSDQNIRSYFETTYFELSAQAFQNLNELFADLEWTKMYLNEQKSQTHNYG
jgi:hypothetical protein